MATTPTLSLGSSQVNSRDGGFVQTNSDIVALPDGGYLIVWEDSPQLNFKFKHKSHARRSHLLAFECGKANHGDDTNALAGAEPGQYQGRRFRPDQ